VVATSFAKKIRFGAKSTKARLSIISHDDEDRLEMEMEGDGENSESQISQLTRVLL